MPLTYIGATLSIIASTPTAEDQSAYEALSLTEIGRVISIGELKDNAEDVNFNLLKTGRTTHVNGVKDAGEIAVMLDFDTEDAGWAIVEAGNNSNTTHTFLVTDPDGEDVYFQGLIANAGDPERNASAHKAKEFVIRSQTGFTRVAPA